jgi:ubiquitin C-terminal hydrolase
VQYLLRVEPLTQYSSSDEFQHSRTPTNPKRSGCIVLDAYCNLAKEILTARGHIARVALKEATGRYNELCSGHYQRDANECLLTFFDLIHEDLNQPPGALQCHFDFDFTPYNEMKLHHVWNESIISHLFHGITISHLNSDCGNRQDHINTFIFWQLPLPTTHSTTLEECIETWRKTYRLTGDNGLFCPTCYRTVDCT